MALYAISDTHLSLTTHKPMNIFGARWDNFETILQENWQKTVTCNDTTIIAGDISWGMTLEEAKEDFRFINSLNGKKIISCGNHDYWWETMKKMKVFVQQNGFETIDFMHNNAYFCEDYIICGTRGWYYDEKTAPIDVDYNKILDREVGRLEMSINEGIKLNKSNNKMIAFLHFPPIFGEFVLDKIVNVLEKYEIKHCYYGHIHGKYDLPQIIEYNGIKFQIISADYLNFCPIRVNI